jgi:hypothetical protein
MLTDAGFVKPVEARMDVFYLLIAAMIGLMLLFWVVVTGCLILLAWLHDRRSTWTIESTSNDRTPPVQQQQPGLVRGATT